MSLPPVKNPRAATLALFAVVFVNLVGFGIVIPLLPFYSEHYGAEPDTVTLVMGIYSAAQFVTAPLWGRLSDRYGRRPILIASLAGTLVSYLWLAYASTLWELFASRALAGFMAGSIAGAFAYMADITDEANRSRGMGMIGAAFGLGFIAGPAIGGLLAGGDPSHIDFALPALAAVGFCALALILATTLLPESLPAEVRMKMAERSAQERRGEFSTALKRPGVRPVVLLTFLAVFAFAGLEAVFALWSERTYGWSVRQNGYVFAFLGLISAMIQGGLIGRLNKRFGEAGLVRQGFLTLALGLAAIPFATNLPVLLAALVVATYGFSVAQPALSSLLTFGAPQGSVGGLIGIGRSAQTLARAGGPVFAGFVFDTFGKDWPFLSSAAILLVILILSGRLIGHSQSRKAEAS